MEIIKVYIEKTDLATRPQSGSPGSAGFDIVAAEDAIILPGATKLLATGLKLAIPRGYEIQIRPRSGLSLKTSLRIANSPGTIDSDYRDEIKVICQNTYRLGDWKNSLLDNPDLIYRLSQYKRVSLWDYLTDQLGGLESANLDTSSDLKQRLKQEMLLIGTDGLPFGTLKILKGERFAQMVFSSYAQPSFEQIESLEGIGQDRGGGFGSTGRH